MNNFKIEDLIPHRDRMKFIEEVIDVDDEKAITLTTVNEEWPFYGDSINPIILIEVIAQTAAIAVGNRRIGKTGEGASGWLVGIKHASFTTIHIPVGTKLKGVAKRKYDRGNYAVFSGVVKMDEEQIFETELQLFNPEY